MRPFIIVTVALFAWSTIWKAIQLHEQDFIRKPDLIVWDIAFSIAVIIWGSYLLNNN